MYIVEQVPFILPHRVLVRGSVGSVYWSGVRPCTGQGIHRGPRTGQGSDRVLVRDSVEGCVLVRGLITRVCIYISILCVCIYILYIHRVLVRGRIYVIHTHTHTHTHIGVFFLSPRMHPLVDTGVCLTSRVSRFGLAITSTSLDF